MEIDLSGPDGNVFYLLGMAKKLAKAFDIDPEPIINKMMSGDYGNAVAVFEEEFGDIVTLVK